MLSRSAETGDGRVRWDGRTLGPWTSAIDGADAVINLSGRSVDCRYNKTNLSEMLSSRLDSTRVIDEAIRGAARPPSVWLQASTATIYAHRFDADNDEAAGVLGGHEPDVPAYWRYSIEIARAWEREQAAADTQHTRRVAMRMAIVMSRAPGCAFRIMERLARIGLGGPIAGGRQFMSWVHDRDLVRAVAWLLEHEEIEGVVNIAAPHPLPQAEFMRLLRREVGMPIGIPGSKLLFELAAVLHRTDTELLLKSRRVVSGRLMDAGFRFDFPRWEQAVADLVSRRTGQRRSA